MATGRIDALMFLIGGLVGAGVYMLTYGSITGTPLLDNIAGERQPSARSSAPSIQLFWMPYLGNGSGLRSVPLSS